MSKALRILIIMTAAVFILGGCDKDKKTDGPTASLNPKTGKEEEQADGKTDTGKKKDDEDRVPLSGADDKNAVKAYNKEAKSAYKAFMSDREPAVADYEKKGTFRKGNRYSLSDIVDDYLNEENSDRDEGFHVELYDVRYAYIDCGGDGRKELAVIIEYGMGGYGDYAQQIYMLNFKDGDVHIFADDLFGYRTGLTINEMGYVIREGSGGASLYCRTYYYFNDKCEKIYLYNLDEYMGLGAAKVPKSLLRDGFNRTDYPEDDMSYDGYEAYVANFSEFPQIEYSENTDYYELYYKDNMYAFCDHKGDPVKPDKDMIDFYAKEGIDWYDYDELMDMLDDHVKEMGVTDEIKDADEAEFTSLLDEGIFEHEYTRADDANGSGEEENNDSSADVKTFVIHDVDKKPYISSSADKDHSYNKVRISQLSCVQNEITDREDWFKRAHFNPPGNDASDDTYRYVLTGDAGYNTMTIVEIYDKGTDNLRYRFDLSDLLYAKGYEGVEFADRGVRAAFVTDDYLYLNIDSCTYAETCPDNAFMMCIDINSGEIVWVSDTLVSNSDNFVRWGDNIITGYGFTAEDDYIYILNRFTGEVTEKIRLKKSPDYFAFVDGDLWVRTYSYDYVFSLADD
ncbi:MAG: hypothetical protein J5811_00480 [Lachnospiraceae bacterium]|nr:hypothetical protein [Lachnospiraceae bacterium]